MKREAGKVFLACAIGAGIGSLAALEMTRAFWWIGLLIGGLSGYLSYEWRAVLRAIPAAYRAARGWRAPKGYWQAIGLYFVFVSMMILWFSAVLLAAIVSKTPPEQLISDLTEPIYWVVAGMFTIGMVFVVVLAIADRNGPIDDTLLCELRKANYWIFPPIVLFWHLPRGIWWLQKRLPRAITATVMDITRCLVALVRFVKRFTWQLFLRIHSEMRLLCGVDAMLGAAVGYFAGSAIVGAITGGVFGVLNYAVITERWLKPNGYLPIR